MCQKICSNTCFLDSGLRCNVIGCLPYLGNPSFIINLATLRYIPFKMSPTMFRGRHFGFSAPDPGFSPEPK